MDAWLLPEISPADLLWLAGLLEGEGCFSEQYKHAPTMRGFYVLPSIQLAMTDRDVVLRAGKLIGGNQKRLRSSKLRSYKRQFNWRVNGKRAVHVMSLLLPLMGLRRTRRITQILTSYKRRRGPNGAFGFTRRPKKSVKARRVIKVTPETKRWKRQHNHHYYMTKTKNKRRERRRLERLGSAVPVS